MADTMGQKATLSMGNRMVFVGIIVLSLLGWVVFMGGLAALTSYYDDVNRDTADLGLDWTLWFMQPALLVTILWMSTAGSLGQYATAMVGLLSMFSAVIILRIHTFVVGAELSSGKWSSAQSAAAAGYILMVIPNIILIVLIGSGDASAPPDLLSSTAQRSQRDRFDGNFDTPASAVASPPPAPITYTTNTTPKGSEPADMQTPATARTPASATMTPRDDNDVAQTTVIDV